MHSALPFLNDLKHIQEYIAKQTGFPMNQKEYLLTVFGRDLYITFLQGNTPETVQCTITYTVSGELEFAKIRVWHYPDDKIFYMQEKELLSEQWVGEQTPDGWTGHILNGADLKQLKEQFDNTEFQMVKLGFILYDDLNHIEIREDKHHMILDTYPIPDTHDFIAPVEGDHLIFKVGKGSLSTSVSFVDAKKNSIRDMVTISDIREVTGQKGQYFPLDYMRKTGLIDQLTNDDLDHAVAQHRVYMMNPETPYSKKSGDE